MVRDVEVNGKVRKDLMEDIKLSAPQASRRHDEMRKN